MNYSIIQPPFTLKFDEMPKKDLVAYAKWFHDIMPKRLAELEREVGRTPGFDSWVSDLSPDSLSPLGDWFAREVKTRIRSETDVEEISSRLVFPMHVSGVELTNRTLSLAMDIGMYLGCVVKKHAAGAQWDQPLDSRRDADYGQTVLVGLPIGVPFNPVSIVVNLAYGIARKQQGGRRLRELFDVWAKRKA